VAESDVPRPVVHWEIAGVDAEALREFYRGLFHWEIGDGPIMAINPAEGGPLPGPGGHLRPARGPRVTLYVQVRDLAESLDRAVDLGGSVAMEITRIPDQPTLAGIRDPEGTVVMLVQQ